MVDHGKYIMGPEVAAFEKKLAAFCGAKHVSAAPTAPTRSVLALMAKDLKRGQAVLVPSFTFAATAEVVAWFGAMPVFVDVREDTFNMDPASLEAGIATRKAPRARTRRRSSRSISSACRPITTRSWRSRAAHGLWVICDAAQSFGAVYKGRTVGTFGDITTTSFFPAKPLGCYGDGGAIFTDDDDRPRVLQSLRVHGQGRDKYDNVRIGMNARLDTIQAAVLIEKLRFSPTRSRRASGWPRDMASCSRMSRRCRGDPGAVHQRVGAVHDASARGLRPRHSSRPAQGRRACRPRSIMPKPLHQQTAYRHYPVAGNGLPVSDRLAAEVLSLPMHPYLAAPTQQRISDALRLAFD